VSGAAGSIDFDVVVAADLGDGIGAAGKVPWRLPSDLAFLKRITTETTRPGARNAVLMGRITWDTIPDRFRPLPRRLNVVLTRQPEFALPAGVLRAGSLDDGLRVARAADGVETLFVLGGGEIYRQAMALDGCRHIYLTRVLARTECDAFFPPIPPRFGRQAVLGEGRDDGLGYRIERWTRHCGST
jgi:dihydrofolate reductase